MYIFKYKLPIMENILNCNCSKKTFECLKCKKKIDRDYNGARNILLRTLTKHALNE